MQLRTLLVAWAVSVFSASVVFGGTTYKADPDHAEVGFSVSHLVISKVKGHFDAFDASLTLDDDGNVAGAEATIQAGSVNTSNTKRDDHLKGPEFFDVAQYPTITFASTGTAERDGQSVLLGKFTVHGVTQEIELPYTVKGPVQDPWGNTKLGFEAELKIDRTEYGLTWSKTMEAGGLVVGTQVTLSLNLEFAKEQSEGSDASE